MKVLQIAVEMVVEVKEEKTPDEVMTALKEELNTFATWTGVQLTEIKWRESVETSH